MLLTLELLAVGSWIMFHLPTLGGGLVTAALLVPFHVTLVLPTLVAAWTRDIG